MRRLRCAVAPRQSNIPILATAIDERLLRNDAVWAIKT